MFVPLVLWRKHMFTCYMRWYKLLIQTMQWKIKPFFMFQSTNNNMNFFHHISREQNTLIYYNHLWQIAWGIFFLYKRIWSLFIMQEFHVCFMSYTTRWKVQYLILLTFIEKSFEETKCFKYSNRFSLHK